MYRGSCLQTLLVLFGWREERTNVCACSVMFLLVYFWNNYYLCDLLSVISKQLQLNKKSYYINQTALNDQILTNLSSVWNFGAVRSQERRLHSRLVGQALEERSRSTMDLPWILHIPHEDYGTKRNTKHIKEETGRCMKIILTNYS